MISQAQLDFYNTFSEPGYFNSWIGAYSRAQYNFKENLQKPNPDQNHKSALLIYMGGVVTPCRRISRAAPHRRAWGKQDLYFPAASLASHAMLYLEEIAGPSLPIPSYVQNYQIATNPDYLKILPERILGLVLQSMNNKVWQKESYERLGILLGEKTGLVCQNPNAKDLADIAAISMLLLHRAAKG